MTDRLESSATGPPPDRPRPFGRFVPPLPPPRRLAPRALIAAAGLVLLAWLGQKAARWVGDYLAAQPAYQLPFADIELEPPPPPFLRDGKATILDRVARQSKLPDPIPVLNVDLGEITRAFALNSPWISRVEPVIREHPNRLIVHAVYREPIARLDARSSLAIDAEGVVLPGNELVPGFAESLVLLGDLKTPIDASPGLILGGKTGEPDPEIASALRLARFFREKAGAGPKIDLISLGLGPGRVYVRTSDGLKVFWGDASRDDPNARESAHRRWELLTRWVQEHPGEGSKDGKVLLFTRDGVKKVRPDDGS